MTSETTLLTSSTTFRFPSNTSLQLKKRKEVSLIATPRLVSTSLQLDNYYKRQKKEKPPLKKTKFSMQPLKTYRQERNLKSTQDNN